MKTAISIPDNVYESAEKLAMRLGKSRSQLYTQAVSSYISQHRSENVTTKLNEVYSKNDSSSDLLLADLQFRSLPKEEW
jgi:metal-responsive CopG/Arc/MetJ family transcriptional regulator